MAAPWAWPPVSTSTIWMRRCARRWNRRRKPSARRARRWCPSKSPRCRPSTKPSNWCSRPKPMRATCGR
ncbi:Uncharacterised protein [Bordetella pertussis]|nr:Uncharacterised protein [Bordetella pertussis]